MLFSSLAPKLNLGTREEGASGINVNRPLVFSVKFKHFYYLFILLSFPPFILYSQSSNTKFKAGLESGIINTERFGDGLFFRPFIKISGHKKFTNSILKIKTNVSSEILDLKNRVSGLHLFANIEYAATFGHEKLSLSTSAKNQVHFIKSLKKQLFNEFQLRIQFVHNFSTVYSFQIKKWLIHREQVLNVKNRLTKNGQQADFIIKYFGRNLWKLGAFYEKTDFNYPQNINKHQWRFGPAIEFNYNKSLILSAAYKYGFYKNSPLNDHQINFLIGKYLFKKTSLFLFAYYLWRENRNSTSDRAGINSLESYNHISLKVGYDLKKETHIYIKILFEEQEIFQRGSTVSTFQGMFGLLFKYGDIF